MNDRSRAANTLSFGWSEIGPDQRGAVLVEAAFVLPILIVLLVGTVTYGLWLTAAANLQHVANEAARASLAGVNDAERAELAQAVIAGSLVARSVIDSSEVETELRSENGFYTVTLTYDASAQGLFANSIVPLPSDAIVRSATIEMASW